MYGLPNGADSDQVSAKLMNDYYKFKGEEHFVLKGYSQICEALTLSGFPITLSEAVSTLDYTSPGPLKTLTKSGKTYESEHVIVTLPLGVLKAGDVTFVPPLPKSKLASIARLGVSLMDKLYLEFEGDQPFWSTEVDLMNIIQDDWTLIVNCYKLHTGRPVLLMFNYGSRCIKYAKYSDEDLVESALTALRKIFPGKELPPVKSFLRTNWGDD